MKRSPIVLVWLLCAVLLQQCARNNTPESRDAASSENEQFTPYVIADSSAITTYPNGLKIYFVQEGPGQFPRDGMNIRMNYHGMLEDGEVFDSTFRREKPFSFTLGQTPVIEGLHQALQKMRFGTKAIVIVPPALGYGDGEKRPANIPPGSTLIFHIDLLGSF